MKLSRDWATPWVMGAFVLTGVTGVLMFFHLDRGLNKPAHEWLGWLMVAGVGLHAAANWQGFKRHLSTRAGRLLVGLGVLLLALSFFQPAGAKRAPVTRQVVQAVSEAPLAVAAPVFSQDEAGLRDRLRQQGWKVPDGPTSLTAIAQANGRENQELLALVLRRDTAR